MKVKFTKKYFYTWFLILSFILLNNLIYSSSLSNNFTIGPDDYYYDSLSLNLDLSKDIYGTLSGSYSKEEKNSWVGSKNYSFGIGGYSDYGSGELNYSLYKSQNTYESSTFDLIFNLNVNSIIKGKINKVELLLEEEENPDNFLTNIYFNLGLTNHKQDIEFPNKIVKINLGQISFTFGVNETIFNDTAIRLYYSFYLYNKDLNKLSEIDAKYFYLFSNPNALFRIYGFPSNNISTGISQYLFNIFYLSFDYSHTNYVLVSPSDSYNISIGIPIFEWLELNGSYNLNVSPDNKTEYYSIGTIFKL